MIFIILKGCSDRVNIKIVKEGTKKIGRYMDTIIRLLGLKAFCLQT